MDNHFNIINKSIIYISYWWPTTGFATSLWPTLWSNVKIMYHLSLGLITSWDIWTSMMLGGSSRSESHKRLWWMLAYNSLRRYFSLMRSFLSNLIALFFTKMAFIRLSFLALMVLRKSTYGASGSSCATPSFSIY